MIDRTDKSGRQKTVRTREEKETEKRIEPRERRDKRQKQRGEIAPNKKDNS